MNTAAFAILHLLPMDIAVNHSLADIVLHYQTVLLANSSNQTFRDDVTMLTSSGSSPNVCLLFFFSLAGHIRSARMGECRVSPRIYSVVISQFRELGLVLQSESSISISFDRSTVQLYVGNIEDYQYEQFITDQC